MKHDPFEADAAATLRAMRPAPAPERPDGLVTVDGGIVMVQLPGMSRTEPLTDSMLSRLLLAAPAPDAGLRFRATDADVRGWDTDEGWDIRRDILRNRAAAPGEA
jgi:hypothetical protein